MTLEDKSLRCPGCGQWLILTSGKQDFCISSGFTNELGLYHACRWLKGEWGAGGKSQGSGW